MRTLLRNGLDRYEVLKSDEPLRRGERLVRFGSERGALEFLVSVGGPGRRDLQRLVDREFMGEFPGVADQGVPGELARRVFAGRLKIVRVETAPPRLRSAGGEFAVLDARDRLRRGESPVRMMNDATAIRFARLLSTLPREEQRRLQPVAAAVGGGSQREQTRSLSRLLLRGQIRIVRLQTLTPAGGSAPPPAHDVSAFGVADAISLGVGFIPIVGDAVDIVGAIAGKDLITGEKIEGAAVAATIVGTILGSGKLARVGTQALSPLGEKVLKKMAADPRGHGFPRLLEQGIFDRAPALVRSDGRSEFIAKGTINGSAGFFHITRDAAGTIVHRSFTNASDWHRYSNRWGLPPAGSIK